MYYVTPYENNNGDMVIWRHVKRLKDFKADEGVEYLVAKNKKEMKIDTGSSLPIYIGLNGELKKCSTYALFLFQEIIMNDKPLIVWVMEYYDRVAGEKSFDLYKTEEMAQEDKRKLTADGTISDVLIYQRMVWQ